VKTARVGLQRYIDADNIGANHRTFLLVLFRRNFPKERVFRNLSAGKLDCLDGAWYHAVLAVNDAREEAPVIDRCAAAWSARRAGNRPASHGALS